MICEYGGILFVKNGCGKIYYSQPYDLGKSINAVKGEMKKVYYDE
ncbi:hypothetical protein [Cytobacillus gottheilii]|nr:hypothetical protein [Cytobacillus gottheilii]